MVVRFRFKTPQELSCRPAASRVAVALAIVARPLAGRQALLSVLNAVAVAAGPSSFLVLGNTANYKSLPLYRSRFPPLTNCGLKHNESFCSFPLGHVTR